MTDSAKNPPRPNGGTPSPDARPSIVLRVFRSLAAAGLGLFGIGLLYVATLELSAQRVKDPGSVGVVVGMGLVCLAAGVRLAFPIKALWKLRLAVGFGWALLLTMVFVLVAPDLFRAHPHDNEAATIQDLRALVAVPSTASAGLVEPIRWGYRRTLHLPAASAATAAQSRGFAVTATPLEPGRSGVRAFCADTTGAMCFNLDGTAPPVRPDGTCDLDACNTLL